MNIQRLGTIHGGQDGAIFGDLFFRFDDLGNCAVHRLPSLEPVGEFSLSGMDTLPVHSNAVFFGTERYDEGDELPVLYTNVYNACAADNDRREGMLCAFRIRRNGDTFTGTPVQVIRVCFTRDTDLWASLPDGRDVRPYGNFVQDAGKLWAFVMRDKPHETRYLAFRMPSVHEGIADERYGVPTVILTPEDILDRFHGEYMNYMQGAIARDGLLYSLEGFGIREDHSLPTPALRIVDLNGHRQVLCELLPAYGLPDEPECIDFFGDRLLFSNAEGEVYEFSGLRGHT